MFPSNLYIHGKTYKAEGHVQTEPQKQYYMHEIDQVILGRLRDCASVSISPNTSGCPAVWTMNEPALKTKMTKDWQFYLCAINSNMRPEKVMQVLEYQRALANGTGIGAKNPPRKNYITGENLRDSKAIDPALDKDRTMSMSMLASADGVEYTGTIVHLGERYRGYIIIRVLDGNSSPPMKPGRPRPQRLEDAKMEDYLYNPRDNWDLFFACNIVNTSGKLIPFGGGATYSWFFNGQHPVTFFPHVSREMVIYPTALLKKLPLGTERILPYTR